MFRTAEQLQRAAKRQAERAQHQVESLKAKAELESERHKKQLEDNALAWIIYHKAAIRTKDAEFKAKLDAERRAKMEAIRQAERMNAKRMAAKRLRIREDAYTADKEQRKERDKLRRNTAKSLLHDARAVEKKK